MAFVFAGLDVVNEDDSVMVCAQWKHVRNEIHKQEMRRGFFQPKGGSKGKSKNQKGGLNAAQQFARRMGNFTRPVRTTLQKLISRTKCARCGQVGHTSDGW